MMLTRSEKVKLASFVAYTVFLLASLPFLFTPQYLYTFNDGHANCLWIDRKFSKNYVCRSDLERWDRDPSDSDVGPTLKKNQDGWEIVSGWHLDGCNNYHCLLGLQKWNYLDETIKVNIEPCQDQTRCKMVTPLQWILIVMLVLTWICSLSHLVTWGKEFYLNYQRGQECQEYLRSETRESEKSYQSFERV
jgi:hypothetical protein